MNSSAGRCVRAAIPRDSRINSDGTERHAYAVSSIEPYGIEWVRSDLGEISKFVSGIDGKSIATTQRVNARRCYKTSSSSGYSSHSPLLSIGSCSHYASTSTKDLSYGGLAVIHESETASVPQPIWPPIACHQAENIDYEGIIYTCRVCGCTCNYLPSSSSPSTSSPPKASTREMLLELSQTLNSMIDGDIAVAPEDILHDISRIVSLEIGPRNDNLYEYVCPSWTFNDDLSASPSYIKDIPSRGNSANSELYVSPRAFYENNSVRSALLLKNDKMTRQKNAERERSYKTASGHVLEYLDGRHAESGCAKLSFGLDKDSKRCQNGLTSTESKYSMLDYSDIGSSSEETITSSNDWNGRLAVRGLGKDFDFTLDVTRAERLSRTIAKAKRKRQWCRVLTTLFGLIFFVLSIIVVSLCVTRGRKVFGSI
ncbi:uncharacterized protein [Anoplolepis gracilipes]|uniref:uncharacterized protein isoform X2 n=1 Tax=Anoplolepis gracilipes TaxID=354296 RepID=UPI003BA3B31E